MLAAYSATCAWLAELCCAKLCYSWPSTAWYCILTISTDGSDAMLSAGLVLHARFQACSLLPHV